MPTALEVLTEVHEFPTSAHSDNKTGTVESQGQPHLLFDALLSIPVLIILGWTASRLR